MRLCLMTQKEKCMIRLEAQTAIHLKDFNKILILDLIKVIKIQDFKVNPNRILIQTCLINSKAVFLVLTHLKEEWEDFKTYLEIYLIKEQHKAEWVPKHSC